MRCISLSNDGRSVVALVTKLGKVEIHSEEIKNQAYLSLRREHFFISALDAEQDSVEESFHTSLNVLRVNSSPFHVFGRYCHEKVWDWVHSLFTNVM